VDVARGWGKSFEDQVEEGNQRVSDSEERTRLSAESRVRLERLTALKLSRSRTLEQLERARHQAHREVLLKGLQAVEKEIEEIKKISQE
jgi:seryl-tRNA synthetase